MQQQNLQQQLNDFHFSLFFEEMSQKQLNPFGISPFSILFIAKSRSGKSFVVRYIQYLLKFCILKSFIFCPTEIDQQFYQKYLNKSKIFLKPDFQKIKQIFHNQTQMVSFLRNQYEKMEKDFGFKNQFLKFIPLQYFKYLDFEQFNQKVFYLKEEQLKDLPQFENSKNTFIHYKQSIVMKNSQNYYNILYNCVKMVKQLWKEKQIQKVCELLQIEEKSFEKLSSLKIELIVNDQFQRQNPNIFMIFDDCMKDPKFTKQEETVSMLFEGRHKYISTLLITQQLMRVSKDLRQNFGYIVLSKQQDFNVISEIQKQYVCEIKEKVLMEIVIHYTKDYGCIFIDLINQSYENPLQKLYYLKAKNLDGEEFFIGSISQQIQNYYSRKVIEENLYKPKIKRKEKKEEKPQEDEIKLLMEINKKNNLIL